MPCMDSFVLPEPDVTLLTVNRVEDRIRQLKRVGHVPYTQHSYELAALVYEEYRNKFYLVDEAKELLNIMSHPSIRALFDVHDRVANQEYLPALPDILPQCDDNDRAVKIVRLLRNDEPLGVTIKNRDSDGVICVARVFVGGPAERSGLVQVGDEVHEVNGIPVRGRPIEEVVHILNSCDGMISLKLIPDFIDETLPKDKVKIRARFSYDPSADLLIPCQAAGLSFVSGDILEILNTDDPLWWQARLFYDQSSKTGLIPSRTLQIRRSTEMYNSSAGRGAPGSPSLPRKISPPLTGVSQSMGSLLSPRLQRKVKKHRKTKCQATIIDDGKPKCLQWKTVYEEVQLYKPPIGRKRPLVILGPKHVGTHGLKQKLVKDNQEYISPVPVTSRPKKLLETDGKDFIFISKLQMDSLLQKQKLLEFGEYKGHLYGITIDSVHEAMETGHTCVLVCQPQTLTILRCAKIKPLVVFIKPPSLEKLRQMKVYTGGHANTKLSANEVEEMVLGAAMIESVYSQAYDETIINTEFNQSYNQLISISRSVNSTENWIPSSWLD
ncbi:MAGUK p55 subfamily member 7-like isoform X1 [Watersipora subatra]|uniref:MAGUK p55 subfamily member 7-like isoform X1 n=1 Tax=Watersipora subatra TaxID=2589382 RepID=UPI00355C4324